MNQVDVAGISWRITARDLRRVDTLVLFLTAPFLLAPGQFPRIAVLIALAVLIIPFAVRYRNSGYFTNHTPGNNLIVVLLAFFIPLAILMSPALWEITWPRVTVLVWSISVFFAVINWPASDKGQPVLWRQWMDPALIYLGLGGLVALVGFFGMRSVDKLFYLPINSTIMNRLGIEQGLPTNEIAGVLTLFIPFAVALILADLTSHRKRALLWLLPLTLLMVMTLVLSQSRTGLVAAMIGIVLVFAFSGIIIRRLFFVMLGIAALGVFGLGLAGLLDRFIFAGANSWASVINPRLGIWQQAIDGLRDHSPWGMGFGVFGRSAGLLYPLIDPSQPRVLEDAHNLYLQTALDFGVIGGLVFFLLLAIAVITASKLAIAQKSDRLSRLWMVGLLASLIAHLLYSLTDAVSLGTLAGIPLWFLLGLIFGPARKNSTEWSEKIRPGYVLVGAVGVVILVSVWLWYTLPVNRAGQLTARYLLDPTSSLPETATTTRRLAANRCQAYWFEGLLYHSAGDTLARSAAWKDLLTCTNRYIRYMTVVAAEDTALAHSAIQAYPHSADAYFWLAAALTGEDPDSAIAFYRQGLSLSPKDGLRWQMMADLLVSGDPIAAEEAYYQSCLNGDPGANGCLRAGGLAEARGDVNQAIDYLRLSKFEEAQTWADELEARGSAIDQSN